VRCSGRRGRRCARRDEGAMITGIAVPGVALFVTLWVCDQFGVFPAPLPKWLRRLRERHEIIAHLMMAAFFIGLAVLAMILIDLGSAPVRQPVVP
jgi:hypothetical protein